MVALPRGANFGMKPVAAVRSLVRGGATPITIPCSSDADGCLAMCNDDQSSCTILAPLSLLHRLKVASLFGLWFALSVCYSITNKRINNVLPCPCSIATSTVAVGSMFVSTLWLTGLRSAPGSLLPPCARLYPLASATRSATWRARWASLRGRSRSRRWSRPRVQSTPASSPPPSSAKPSLAASGSASPQLCWGSPSLLSRSSHSHGPRLSGPRFQIWRWPSGTSCPNARCPS